MLVSVLAVSAGIALLVVVFVDLVWTTLGVSHGAGPLTSVVLRAGWRAGAPLRRRQAHGAVAVAGVVTVLATLAVWVVILWTAWASMFLGAGGGIVDRTGADAGAWDRIYFAGYSVFTLGNGEFQPEGPAWQMATVVAALSGLTVISLAIAYLVLVFGQFIVGYFFNDWLMANMGINVLFIMGLLLLAVLSAFAYDIQERSKPAAALSPSGQ